PQRRELSHHAVLPHKRETCGTGGKPKRVEAAKILKIRTQSFTCTHGSAPFVDTKRRTVRPSESGSADVDLPSPVPEDGVHCAVSGGSRATYQTIVGDDIRLARRVAHRAEVGDD